MFRFRSSPSGDQFTRFFSRPCWVLSPVVEFPGRSNLDHPNPERFDHALVHPTAALDRKWYFRVPRSNANAGRKAAGAVTSSGRVWRRRVVTVPMGVGSGLATLGAATIDNTTIAGNTASTNENNVDGTFSV